MTDRRHHWATLVAITSMVVSACGTAPVSSPTGVAGTNPATAASSASPAAATATPGTAAPTAAPSAASPQASAPTPAPSFAWPIVATPGPECDAILHDPESVAADIYGALDRPADIRGALALTLPCLGVPILAAASDDATLQRFLDGYEPGLLDAQLDDLAAGLADGVLVDLDSFVADLAALGVTDRASGEPLSRAALDAGIQRLIAAADETSTLPRLLLALSRQREQHGEAATVDPLWGDARLDPVGFLLFGLGLLAAGNQPAGAVGAQPAIASIGRGLSLRPVQAQPPSSSAIDALRTVIAVDRQIGIGPSAPLTWVVCAEGILNHTRLRLDANPFSIWHRNGRKPDTAALVGFLRYIESAIPDRVLVMAGCPPPATAASGGIAGKSISWELGAKASEHGSLQPGTLITDPSGQVRASYQTVAERSAQADQIVGNEKSEPVRIAMNVLDLLPGFTQTSVTTLVRSPSRPVFITVNWYEPRAYTLKVDLQFIGTHPAFASNITARAEFVLRPQDPLAGAGTSRLFEGRGTLTFTTVPQRGNCLFTYSGGGAIAAKALARLQNPVDPVSLVVTIPIRLDAATGDSITATACPPSPATNVTNARNVSLLVLFLIGTEPKGGEFSLDVTDWHASTSPTVIAESIQTGTCGSPAVCNYRGTFTLEPRP